MALDPVPPAIWPTFWTGISPADDGFSDEVGLPAGRDPLTSGGEEALVLIVVTNLYYIASGVFDRSSRLYRAARVLRRRAMNPGIDDGGY